MLLRCRDTLFILRRIEGLKDANHCLSYRERFHDVLRLSFPDFSLNDVSPSEVLD